MILENEYMNELDYDMDEQLHTEVCEFTGGGL